MGNHPDPHSTYAKWLNPYEYVVRREILPETTPRAARRHHKWLPKSFHGAHPWPLQWGGPEIHEAHFNAHYVINDSIQKMLENAGRTFTTRLQGTNIRLFGRSSVTRYPQLNLLERATYRFEAISPNGDIQPLAELSIKQSLTELQIHALVKGQIISGHESGNIVINYEGKNVVIDLKRIVEISQPTLFVKDIEGLVAGLERGGKKPSAASKNARRQQMQTNDKKSPVTSEKGQTSKSPNDPRAISETLKNNRGTITPSEIQVFQEPKYNLPADMPSQRGPTKEEVLNSLRNPPENALSYRLPQQAVEGAALMILTKQHEHVNNKAMSAAKSALADRQLEISRYQEKGEHVWVTVTFTEPIRRDVFGLEPWDYLTFWSINVHHAKPYHPVTGKVLSLERAKEVAMSYPPAYNQAPSSKINREIPAGRTLRTYDFAYYPPLAQQELPTQPVMETDLLWWLNLLKNQAPKYLKDISSRRITLPDGRYGSPLDYIVSTGPFTMERLKHIDPEMYKMIINWAQYSGTSRCVEGKSISNRLGQ